MELLNINHLRFDFMVFNAVFNSILVISLRPVHLSMLSWSSEVLLTSTTHNILSKTLAAFQMDSGERGMNPVAMTIINPRKEYWTS